MRQDQFSPKSIKIVASDLDGTLLLPNHTLGDFTKQVLQKLHQQGLTFIFATGRHCIDVASIRENVGIPAFMITSNGARIHTPDNQLIYSKNIAENVVQEVLNLMSQDPSLTIHLYRSEDWLTSKEDAKLKAFHEDTGFMYQLFDMAYAPTADICKIFFTHTEHEHLAKYEEKLNQIFGQDLSIAFSTPWCLELMAPNVSKGEALSFVTEHLNQSLNTCLAFGDGMNDVEMLTCAHKGLIMQTAHEKVKQALPNHQVIGKNADEAVAHFLEDHLL